MTSTATGHRPRPTPGIETDCPRRTLTLEVTSDRADFDVHALKGVHWIGVETGPHTLAWRDCQGELVPRTVPQGYTAAEGELVTIATVVPERVACNCGGAGHDPTTCASTVGRCRASTQPPQWLQICGRAEGHAGPCDLPGPARLEVTP